MADRYWVGTNTDWHDANNWSLTSGGPGGAGVPTAVDDVFFDSNGNNLCWPTSDIECNNFSLLSGTTVTFILDANGVINGDFLIEDGYFGPTGGPDRTIEFKGNWMNTGGTFAVGTGPGRDPECIFSGIGKTYNLNQANAATFQNVLVSGDVTFSGTRLGVMNISQKLSITGTMRINAYSATQISDVDLAGSNAGFGVFTGELTGSGRLWFRYESGHTLPDSGTITIKYFRFALNSSGSPTTMLLPARTFSSPCMVEVEFTDDNQTFQLGPGNHYFYYLTILGNHTEINTAIFDCDTHTAQIWCENTFKIDSNAFPNAIFTIKFGDGTHVFRGSINFYFAYYAGTSTQLVVDPGEGTIILWPRGRVLRPR